MKKTLIKATAKVLFLSLAYQLFLPNYVYALTAGPTTPEVQSFEPIGTTDMVDMFTGDFTYNIPLMDVEGFPINISYHAGSGIEQEASWVGLGWNINPGEINRSVRGLPDDFNGETIEKKLNINEETDWRFSLGASVSAELFGFNPNQYGLNLSIGVGNYVAFNNYKGVSVGVNAGVTVSTPVASAGVDMGIGSQAGADIDVNAGLSISQSLTQDVGAGIGVSGGTGFNSRTGLKDLSFGISASASQSYTRQRTNKNGDIEKKSHSQSIAGASFGSTIPIGLQNYVPVITNESVQKTFQFQTRFGGEIFYAFPNAHLSIMKSTLKYGEDGSRPGYGYLYSENAPKEGIMDFSREKDGYYNNTLKNLPLSSMTYDVYSISGQGTGGMFRPFRNDIGTVFDPFVNPPKSTSFDVKLEAGLGNLFELGTDLTFYDNENKSGPWKMLPFRSEDTGSFYEKVYFKQAGELTYNNQQQTSNLFNDKPLYVGENETSLYTKGRAGAGSMPGKFGNSYVYTGSEADRTTRANMLSYITAGEADVDDVAQHKKIVSFSDGVSQPFSNPVVNEDDRYGSDANDAKGHHLSEFTQTLPDGRRYIYGTPALNHVTREVSFNVSSGNANISNGLVKIDNGDDTKNNSKGKENFYSHTGTPAYAYSYLLTSVLSKDYVDVLGDGPTDDDLGSFTKINYTKMHDDYRWRAPYSIDSAQYNPGFWSDNDDDKGSYIAGSKQIWHIRSIETKNYVAEFYVSNREDGKGVTGAILPSGSSVDVGGLYAGSSSENQRSYKLDSIKLYNKHDRYINESGNSAVPIKTVVFRYSYRLCKGIPNSFSPNSNEANTYDGGKLTLERIYIKYGNSNKNLLSPYVFSYNGANPQYKFASKDRWGNYQPASGALGSFEYPYVRQDGSADANVSAWSLTDIKLPSGGKIHVDYESDDYSYVQNKRSMQMFMVEGVGNTANYEQKNKLYESVDNVNNYVYFKRRLDRENSSRSMKDNYLENTNTLYYSFNLDISGKGKYEHIKGYAEIEEVGICPNDSDYGYVRLKKERPGNNSNRLLHPATIYGINIGRHYLPHIIYPGYSGGGGPIQILHGLKAAATELMTIAKNPIVRFVEKDKKARNINIAKSWVRLNVPGLTKEGGGLRVKELTLNDNWSSLVGGADANYGKAYDYTEWDDNWGKYVSTGVASYEPMIGGDENPFKVPVPYTSSAGRLLPAIKFFQEEPFGESFFPPPVVGYSKVTVKSIHIDDARSAQSEEEHTFYTAKEFPIEIDYTEKDAPSPVKTKTLRKKYEEVKVMQGYALKFNDMHGKPKGTSYYILNTDGSNVKRERVSGMTYKYQIDNKGKLDNNVNAVVRTRGTNSGYAVQSVKLGEEMDFTIDSRERDIRSFRRNVDINVNVVLFVFVPIPIPTAFFPDKEEKTIFRSMVSTKIIQKYGILNSIETYDHGAKIKTENLLYDSETGAVLLTKTNNEYSSGNQFKGNYNLNIPAYWAYEGMQPAYTNIGYEEKADSLVIETHQLYDSYYGRLFVNRDRFTPGDELLLTYTIDNTTHKVKAWVVDDEDEWKDNNPLQGNFVISPGPHCNSYYEPYPRNRVQCDTSDPVDYVQAEPFRQVVLRALKDANDNVLWPGALTTGSSVSDVYVKVLRSGRRNNLDQHVQSSTLTSNPYTTNISDLIATGTAYGKVLNLSVNEFSDKAAPFSSDSGDYYLTNKGVYNPYIYPVSITDKDMKILNRYVVGHKGNYRPVKSYSYKTDRDYSQNNISEDGTYSISGDAFWTYSQAGRTIMSGIQPDEESSWIAQSEVLKYDVFSNAIEEVDALGKYSSAQYGYNKSLPVAVASNVRQKAFCFEGFEDYDMMVPKYLRALYQGSYYYFTPFANSFNSVQSSLTRYNQDYVRLNLTASSGNAITSNESHSGLYSLQCNYSQDFNIGVRSIVPEAKDAGYLSPTEWRNTKNFSFDGYRKYIVSLWLKPTSGSASTIAANTKMVLGANEYPFQLKTGNIDGWYKAECEVDMSAWSGVAIRLPAGAYFDDVRFVPIDASMKSFVYNPVSFKLIAEQDDNNFSTFYEYDQEGQLIRVKKETERGIVTVSESRRSNHKN